MTFSVRVALLPVYFRYLLRVLFHKACIVCCGLYVRWRLRGTRCAGHPSVWRLCFHDWSKFTPAEFGPYARYFFETARDDAHKERLARRMRAAVRHHVACQDHHAEHYWATCVWPTTPKDRVPIGRRTTTARMPMPAVVELVVDWHAAELSYGGRMPLPGARRWRWAAANVGDAPGGVGLHPCSELLLCAVLQYLGFASETEGAVQPLCSAASGRVDGELRDQLRSLDFAAVCKL